MKTNQNMVTLKIEYTCEDDFSYFIDSYNLILRFTYNRLVENSEISTRELTKKKKGMKNAPDVNSHLYNSAIYDARSLVSKSDKPIIFGGGMNSSFSFDGEREHHHKEQADYSRYHHNLLNFVYKDTKILVSLFL